jgi:C-terminal processing protease CtpA/Prc
MKGIQNMQLSLTQRSEILSKIEEAVSQKFYDPAFNEASWRAIVNEHRESVTKATNAEAFEKAVADMLTHFSPRTLGLLSEKTPITSRNAINASFSVQRGPRGLMWVFQDVLPGGVAARAGVKPGDVLIEAAGEPISPSSETAAEPPFEMQHVIPIRIARGNSIEEIVLSLITGTPKHKDNPYSSLTPVTTNTEAHGVAYLKVSLFQGKVGIDFANEMDRLFSGQFASSDRLIIDLRGNPGGGIGGLTLMSYLTPDRVPIGFSRNRKMALERTNPASLPVLSKIPRSKLAIPGLALKFMGKTSVFLCTEGLGRRSFHGRTLILVNEHTTGAAEMVAQFAQENQLAKILGVKTPGRLVSRSATKLGCGYRLVVPVAAYISAKGTQIEGSGIVPDINVPWSFTDALGGKDNQLAAGVETLL